MKSDALKDALNAEYNRGFDDGKAAAASQDPPLNEETITALWDAIALIAHGMKMDDTFIISGHRRTVAEIWQTGQSVLTRTLYSSLNRKPTDERT